MSANIRGITFAEQTVTPADDAIVRRAMLSDGILSGCSITYSGSTLTLAAGYMIACGRIFQITAARNWAVVDATSGVARLVLTIDLTKTATESAFDQISFGIEYASAENGFVNLTQDDINVAGARYQVTVAVVSLGAGGITGIISKLENAEGGGGLNFKVVAGLTQPGSATENTIWVMTDKISGWIFSAVQPEAPEEGMVWFSTGTSSLVEFNALKKNAIQVYPILAKQYVGGVWVDVSANNYRDGEWVPWWNGVLYDNGDQYTGITGGWVATHNDAENYIEFASDSIKFKDSDETTSSCAVYTSKTVDISDYTTLRMVCDIAKNYQAIAFGIAASNGAADPAFTSFKSPSANGSYTLDLDISAQSGEFYIAVTGKYSVFSIYKIQLL